jgi:DNA-binding NarL/FixJ family response regulator
MIKTRLLLVDDHSVVRKGLKGNLATQSDFTVVGEAKTGREALAHVAQQCPDIVIMDLNMPDLDGIGASQHIRDTCPNTGIIILSMHSSTTLVSKALQAGAKSYLLKGIASSEIITAVRAVLSNQCYLSKKILEQLSPPEIEQLKTLGRYDPLVGLSPREREVLQLVVEGQTSTEIAKALSLSSKTVETYRQRLMRKLNIEDIPNLVKFAIQQGLVPLE